MDQNDNLALSDVFKCITKLVYNYKVIVIYYIPYTDSVCQGSEIKMAIISQSSIVHIKIIYMAFKSFMFIYS